MLLPFGRHVVAKSQRRLLVRSIFPGFRLCRFILSHHLDYRPVDVGPAVSEESPALPHRLIQGEIQLNHQHLLVLLARPGDDPAKRVTDKGAAPEEKAFLSADAVDCCYAYVVCNGMPPLHRLPCITPISFCRLLLVLYPADGSRIEDDLSPAEDRHPRSLREPLVKADHPCDPRVTRIVNPDLLSWGKVALLVKEMIVGNVHLPVDRKEAAVCIDDRQGIVVAALVLLKDWHYYYDR